jgi:hypothetical protein
MLKDPREDPPVEEGQDPMAAKLRSPPSPPSRQPPPTPREAPPALPCPGSTLLPPALGAVGSLDIDDDDGRPCADERNLEAEDEDSAVDGR